MEQIYKLYCFAHIFLLEQKHNRQFKQNKIRLRSQFKKKLNI
ncbi:hypothetical protein pb186bvf_015715 [Paramecium bursaria]